MKLRKSRPVLLLVVGLLLAACQPADGVVENLDIGAETTVPGDLSADDVAPADIAGPGDTNAHAADSFEASAPEARVTGCLPGEGCFLDKCDENSQCQAGWCVEHMGEGVCTKLCQEECPPGWSCKQVGVSDPDVVYVCVSDYSNLCKPCATNDACKSPGGADDVCVGYGETGSFCGGLCDDANPCPWGFTCKESTTVDGVVLKQCVADAGLCPCTGKSVALGLWTPCEVANEFGTCAGKRYCNEDGLSDCDADQPLAEDCNALDDDCDGEVDEPTLEDGKYLELCDDGNVCTKDLCKGADGCQYETLTEGECVDNDACTIGDHCEDGTCKGLPIACDDGNPCTDDFCDGLGGCTAEHNMAPCDDGEPCTVADQCTEGECKGYAVDCDCQEDADCAQLEDGNLCNGTLLCNKDKVPYLCDVVPGSVVECPADGDTICQTSACDPKTGLCLTEPAHEGYACDDGDACTVGDKCVSGQCEAGVAVTCADNNPCTDDVCESAVGCVFTANQLPCDDGNICTTPDLCAEGECQGGGALDCDDGNVCTDDSCTPQKGCVHTANEAQCDDDDLCTTGDQCSMGLCMATGTLDCDDNNACTADSCDADKGCDHDIIAGDCDDGDPCTTGDHCINGLCTPGALADCDDDNPCTDDACGPAGSCLHTPNEQSECTDGNACTIGDHCDAGNCVHGGLENCDDGDLCTTDACDPDTGCVYLLNSLPCDDEDLCTTGDKCQLGECQGTGALPCDDGNTCTDDSCNALTGCTYDPNDEACDDGNACTTSDACFNGWCKSTTLENCGDDNPCTDDSCDPATGCVNTDNSLPCDDGDACTVSEVCAGGACTGGLDVNCDDGNVCTADSCNPLTGCVTENNSDACNDNNGCTLNDQCTGGQCTGVACEDEGQLCHDGECVDHYCGDDVCNQDEDYSNCAADCPLTVWLESTEVEWYPVKYPHDTWKQSWAVQVCKDYGLRLWRDEVGSISSPDWVYDVNDTHNLGGHDIGYKVEQACNGGQETHTGTWVIFSTAWSNSIKAVSGAGNGQNVYILNKQHHTLDYEETASYTTVQPQANSVTWVGANGGGAVSGMTYAVVLCASRK